MARPKTPSSLLDKTLVQTTLLTAELKLLKTEMQGFDPASAKDREFQIVRERLYGLLSRAHLVNDDLYEFRKSFDEFAMAGRAAKEGIE